MDAISLAFATLRMPPAFLCSFSEDVVRDKNEGQIAQRPQFQVEPPSAFLYALKDVVIRDQQHQNSYQNEQDEKDVLGGADRHTAQPFEIENIL